MNFTQVKRPILLDNMCNFFRTRLYFARLGKPPRKDTISNYKTRLLLRLNKETNLRNGHADWQGLLMGPTYLEHLEGYLIFTLIILTYPGSTYSKIVNKQMLWLVGLFEGMPSKWLLFVFLGFLLTLPLVTFWPSATLFRKKRFALNFMP